MSFADRREKSDALTKLLEEHYWDDRVIRERYGILHERYGYEFHISEPTQRALKAIGTKTAKHVRFTPDYIVVRTGTGAPHPVILLEYKVTTTPRYTEGDSQWDLGQVEADAWDNYMNLLQADVRVALLIYCPYHCRPLLCDFPSNDWIVQGRRPVKQTDFGSGTDYYNVDLTRLRRFIDFAHEELCIPVEVSRPLVKRILDRAKVEPKLRITHACKSKFRDREVGFNWEPY